jgi:tetratricopeptide (TPR) repeat protein
MMHNKGVVSNLLFWVAVAAVALMALLAVPRAWLINAWSVRYARYALDLTSNLSSLGTPPAGHARATYWQASAALRAGDPALAETLIVPQAAQGDKLAKYLLVDALLAQDDFPSALAIWQEAGDIDSMLVAASQAKADKRLDDALLAYNAAWILDPELGTSPLANFLLNVSEDYSRAEDVLRQSLNTFPRSGQFSAWCNLLGNVLRAQKRFDEADTWFSKSLSLNPDIPEWYIYRGTTARQAGNLELAISVYQQAIDRFPDNASAYYEIAFAYRLNEDPSRAVAAIEQALALMSPPNALYYARAGGIYEWSGDKSKALLAYRDTLRLDPQNETALKGVERLDRP